MDANMAIEIKYSIFGRKCSGRWYPRPDRISIFLNTIAKVHDPETDFDNFISEISASEFHELGHIYGFRRGCKKCNGLNCYYCQLTDFIAFYLKDGIWYKGYSEHLKDFKLKSEFSQMSQCNKISINAINCPNTILK